MYKIDKNGLARTKEGVLVARPVDSAITAMEGAVQSADIILRLYLKEWGQQGTDLLPAQLHQFVLPAHLAAKLGQQLLELAAQVEKDTGKMSQ